MDAQPDTRPPFVSRLTLGRIAVIAAAVALVYTLYNVILLIFFAALLAAVLRGAADWIAERTGMRVGIALTLIVAAVLAVFAGLGYWIGPRLIQQGHDLVNRLTGQFGALQQRFEGTPVVRTLTQADSSAAPQGIVERVAKPAEEALSISFDAIAGIVVLFVTTLYFAADPELYVRGVVRLVPIPHRPRVHQVMEELAHTLRRWLLGQFVDMVVVGMLSAVGLWLAGVPVPFALGILSGLFTFVPYFGTIVAGLIATLVALSVSFPKALWALGVFTLCHVVEGYVIAPVVQRRLIELPPALTVLAMTVLGTLFGTLGIILGTPLAAVGLVSVRMLYVGDFLGDHDAESPQERQS
jgi:predicted PurR-regulated permease PerM